MTESAIKSTPRGREIIGETHRRSGQCVPFDNLVLAHALL